MQFLNFATNPGKKIGTQNAKGKNSNDPLAGQLSEVVSSKSEINRSPNAINYSIFRAFREEHFCSETINRTTFAFKNTPNWKFFENVSFLNASKMKTAIDRHTAYSSCEINAHAYNRLSLSIAFNAGKHQLIFKSSRQMKLKSERKIRMCDEMCSHIETTEQKIMIKRISGRKRTNLMRTLYELRWVDFILGPLQENCKYEKAEPNEWASETRHPKIKRIECYICTNR